VVGERIIRVRFCGECPYCFSLRCDEFAYQKVGDGTKIAEFCRLEKADDTKEEEQ